MRRVGCHPAKRFGSLFDLHKGRALEERPLAWVRLLEMVLVWLILLSFVEPAGAWVAWFDGGEGHDDVASAVAADSEGNGYVTGYSYIGPQQPYSYTTIKYDMNGNRLWATSYSEGMVSPSSPSEPRSPVMAVDVFGNSLIAGTKTGIDGSNDIVLIKYNADGQEQWVLTKSGLTWGHDRPIAVTTDAEGSVYVIGYTNSSETGYDYMTVKYDAAGNEQWTAVYDGPGEVNDNDLVRDLSVDSSGNVYVTGSSEHMGTGTYSSVLDFLTIKYDAEGDELWKVRYNGPYDYRDDPVSVGTDASGNVYVTGHTYTGASGPSCFADADCFVSTNYIDIVTIKYDSAGTVLWEVVADEESAVGMEVDAAGNVYIVGNLTGLAIPECVRPNLYDPGFCVRIPTWEYIATIKYDAQGERQWLAPFGDPWGDHPSYAGDLALDPDGNVYVVGSSSSGEAYVTVKYDKSGQRLWAARHEVPPGMGTDGAKAVALAPGNNVYVTGTGLSDDSDYVLIRYIDGDPPCIDHDGDAYGDPASPVCPVPEWDCDDTDPAVNPGGSEVCGNGLDDDCNELPDDADPACPCRDLDEDGYGDPVNPNCTYPGLDCDDSNPDVNPGQAEICGNSIDDNCDGNTDDVDEDGDGFLSDQCAGDVDCNDDPSDDLPICSTCSCGVVECAVCARCQHPEAIDFCGDGIDSDCDGESPYPCPANAIASMYGKGSLTGSGMFNELALLLIPLGAVIALRRRRRKT